MPFTRTQTTLLQQTLEGLSLSGVDGVRGTELQTFSRDSWTTATSLLNGPVVVYGISVYRPVGAAGEVFMAINDGTTGNRLLHMGVITSGERTFWFWGAGLRFTEDVRKVVFGNIGYSIFYIPG